MKIKITQADIDKALCDGVRYSLNISCPIAQSITRRYKKPVRVEYNEICIFDSYNKEKYYFFGKNAKRIQKFIDRFDMGRKVRPVEFEVFPGRYHEQN